MAFQNLEPGVDSYLTDNVLSGYDTQRVIFELAQPCDVRTLPDKLKIEERRLSLIMNRLLRLELISPGDLPEFHLSVNYSVLESYLPSLKDARASERSKMLSLKNEEGFDSIKERVNRLTLMIVQYEAKIAEYKVNLKI